MKRKLSKSATEAIETIEGWVFSFLTCGGDSFPPMVTGFNKRVYLLLSKMYDCYSPEREPGDTVKIYVGDTFTDLRELSLSYSATVSFLNANKYMPFYHLQICRLFWIKNKVKFVISYNKDTEYISPRGIVEKRAERYSSQRRFF